ncbi:hypothetical protein M422DRAFT_48542 [Sphaerobolus stellatus SS14]|uniref:Uncharacterized protein n=1 Tax=Sphaerobolus stellatus (strain SS14) TaxID=990650 RepID=A0A0C9UF79_SPHS4|nr:hypothetical protein M422DRAFT_48542 [Sphaerobolus stellatus SS14]
MEIDVLDYHSTEDEGEWDTPGVPEYSIDLIKYDYASIIGDHFTDSVRENVHCMSLDEVCHLYYGVLMENSKGKIPSKNADITLQQSRSNLTEIAGEISEDQGQHLTKFVALVLGEEDPSSIRADLTIDAILEKMQLNGWLGTVLLARINTSEGQEFSIVEKLSMGHDMGWILTTPDPVIAMFCIQKTIDTPANIGRNLLEHGIPFRMSFEVSNMEHRQVP